MAVLEVFSTANTTKATVVTMVRFFFVGHPEVTTVAVIRAELITARYTEIASDQSTTTARPTKKKRP